MSNKRHTRIVCTIGPSSADEKVMEKLIKAGMNVARLNFSHGTFESHREMFEKLRKVSVKHGRFLAILQDLSGPKIRLGEVEPGVVLKKGQKFTFTAKEVKGNSEIAHISYPLLAKEVLPGNRILLDDGLLELKVDSIDGDKVIASVVVGGPISSHKGVNLPGAKLSVPSLTEKDAEDLKFGLKLGVDYVAMSFVRSAKDYHLARKIMEEVGIIRPIIAKIEKPEAVKDMENIVNTFDGIMVARGDLGVEIPLQEVPVIQKKLIKMARDHYKPVITATQMLDSMIRNPRPTRAEVSDVANAILDGTDAVMLSGETASGSYPVEAVEVMDEVAVAMEKTLDYEKIHVISTPQGCCQEEIALAACELADVVDAKVILACSSNGITIRNISHFRPRCTIAGVAHNDVLARQCSLLFGVETAFIPKVDTIESLVSAAAKSAIESKTAKKGDTAVVVAGVPVGSPTNLIFKCTL